MSAPKYPEDGGWEIVPNDMAQTLQFLQLLFQMESHIESTNVVLHYQSLRVTIQKQTWSQWGCHLLSRVTSSLKDVDIAPVKNYIRHLYTPKGETLSHIAIPSAPPSPSNLTGTAHVTTPLIHSPPKEM